MIFTDIHLHSLYLVGYSYEELVDMASEESWVGITDVAGHLSVAKDSIYRWVESKDFPAHRVGRLLRFRLSEVHEWVKSGGGSAPKNHATGRTTPVVGKE